MGFKWIVVSIIDGMVYGSNDQEKVNNLRESEEHFIIEPYTNTWLTSSDEVIHIKELP